MAPQPAAEKAQWLRACVLDLQLNLVSSCGILGKLLRLYKPQCFSTKKLGNIIPTSIGLLCRINEAILSIRSGSMEVRFPSYHIY